MLAVDVLYVVEECSCIHRCILKMLHAWGGEVHVLAVVWALKMPMGIVLVMDVPIKVVAEVVCMLLLVVLCRVIWRHSSFLCQWNVAT